MSNAEVLDNLSSFDLVSHNELLTQNRYSSLCMGWLPESASAVTCEGSLRICMAVAISSVFNYRLHKVCLIIYRSGHCGYKSRDIEPSDVSSDGVSVPKVN